MERTSVTCVPAGVNSDAARSVVSRLPALARKSSSLAASSGAQRLARPAARSRRRDSRAATSRRSRSAGSMRRQDRDVRVRGVPDRGRRPAAAGVEGPDEVQHVADDQPVAVGDRGVADRPGGGLEPRRLQLPSDRGQTPGDIDVRGGRGRTAGGPPQRGVGPALRRADGRVGRRAWSQPREHRGGALVRQRTGQITGRKRHPRRCLEVAQVVGRAPRIDGRGNRHRDEQAHGQQRQEHQLGADAQSRQQRRTVAHPHRPPHGSGAG